MFMVVNLEGSAGDIEVELPSGQWLAPDPEQETEGTYLKSRCTLSIQRASEHTF